MGQPQLRSDLAVLKRSSWVPYGNRHAAASRLDKMTTIELKTLRTALNNKLAEIGGSNGSREALAIDMSPDELDRIQNASEREYAMRDLERNSTRLREVRQALLRMEHGVYGTCLNCEEEIKPRRLSAIPWAALCISCQEAADIAALSGDGEEADPLELAA